MDHAGLRRIAEACVFETWTAGDSLTVQGNEDKNLFVVLSGLARVLVDGEVVGQVESGDSFGEIAMLHEVPRRATIEALSAMTTSRLDRGDLYRAFGADQGERRSKKCSGSSICRTEVRNHRHEPKVPKQISVGISIQMHRPSLPKIATPGGTQGAGIIELQYVHSPFRASMSFANRSRS